MILVNYLFFDPNLGKAARAPIISVQAGILSSTSLSSSERVVCATILATTDFGLPFSMGQALPELFSSTLCLG